MERIRSMKKIVALSLALLCAAPALAQENSVSASVSSGPITAGRIISISVGAGGMNGAMAARVQMGGSYAFQKIGNAPAVETFSPFAPNVTFAKNGGFSGGVSATQRIPGQSFNMQMGSIPAAGFQPPSFQAPSFFAAPSGFF
jgi:hypothetical protein